MSPTISELSMCFSPCLCLSHFLVFKHFQIIKISYYCWGHSTFQIDKRKLPWHRKNALIICCCSKSKLSFCNHKLLKQRQTYAEWHHFSKERWYTNQTRTLWNIFLRGITEHMLWFCEPVVLIILHCFVFSQSCVMLDVLFMVINL